MAWDTEQREGGGLGFALLDLFATADDHGVRHQREREGKRRGGERHRGGARGARDGQGHVEDEGVTHDLGAFVGQGVAAARAAPGGHDHHAAGGEVHLGNRRWRRDTVVQMVPGGGPRVRAREQDLEDLFPARLLAGGHHDDLGRHGRRGGRGVFHDRRGITARGKQEWQQEERQVAHDGLGTEDDGTCSLPVRGQGDGTFGTA
jgi:hypothetical protein